MLLGAPACCAHSNMSIGGVAPHSFPQLARSKPCAPALSNEGSSQKTVRTVLSEWLCAARQKCTLRGKERLPNARMILPGASRSIQERMRRSWIYTSLEASTLPRNHTSIVLFAEIDSYTYSV